MKYSRALVALVAAVSTFAQDNNYTTGLTAALNGAGLTALATAIGAAPPALLSALQQGNHTVFAPSNSALEGIDPSALTNLANILSYHVTAGVVDDTALNTSATVVRTALSASPAVLLPGNQSQVVVLDKAENGTVRVHNAGRNISVVANATYQNLKVWAIDSVLQIPGNLSSVVASTEELSALAAAIGAAAPSLIPAATRQRGLTLFAPNNAAITAAAAQLGAANETTIQAVLLNHVINGTVVYSPQVTSSTNVTSAGGQPLTFTVNSTGTWVTSGSSSARIVQANVLTSNGVVHIIDGVLLNTASDPGAASSAYDSATSVAATQTSSQTEPVTTPNAGFQNLNIATPLKIAAGLVVGALVGTTLL